MPISRRRSSAAVLACVSAAAGAAVLSLCCSSARAFAVQLPPASATGPAGTATSSGTTFPAASGSASQPPSTSGGAPRPAHRSHITFANGLLTVSAANASLNSLIREIAQQTGMKVSGSVAEDRVFGDYGPADPQKVLAALLDGTGSNILILSNARDAPLQLILTPRTGAATPPSSGASLENTDDDDDNPSSAPVLPPVSAPRDRAAFQPGSTPRSTAPATNTTTQPATTPADATTGTTDTGVRTPQQIFEQLQRLRQNSGTASPTPQ